MKNKKDFLVCTVLPCIALGMFLFYLFWAAPVSLILQEYRIFRWYLLSNSYLQIAFICCAILFLIQVILYKKIPNLTTTIIIFVLSMAFLYTNIIPYSYGFFSDNNTLTPAYSLLGFSKWYYLLDIVFFIISVLLTIISIRKKKSSFLLFFFILYYTVFNISSVQTAINKKTTSDKTTIGFSKNKPNVIYYVFDGLGTHQTEYYLTNNTFSEELTNWSKDFTFFKNTVALTTVATTPSYPSMYNGFSVAPQYMFDIKLNEPKYYEEQDKKFKEELSPFATIYGNGQTFILPTNIPIFQVEIYKSLPYALRYLIANDFSWKYNNTQFWTDKTWNSSDEIQYDTINTSKPVIYNTFIGYTHSPWLGQGSPFENIEDISSVKDMDTHLSYATKKAFTEIRNLIEVLKDLGVYSNTTLIIASDHGTHDARGTKFIFPFLAKLAGITRDVTNKTDYFQLHHLASLLMVKHLGQSYNQMQYNTNFLSLADIRATIENSIGITNQPDYTKITPPKRIFNIPLISYDERITWEIFYGGTKEYWQKNKMNFIQISSVEPFIQATNSKYPNQVSIEDVKSIPPFEIIE